MNNLSMRRGRPVGGRPRRTAVVASALVMAMMSAVGVVIPPPAAGAPIAGTPDRAPLPHETTAAVGAVAGSNAVTDQGGAAYSIPITVPPGIAGMQPAVALAYDPGRRGGVLGRGWSVTGQSVIERCPLNYAQGRGTPKPIATGPGQPGSTSYCLDGQLLVEVPRTAGTGDGVEYRTEEETWVKVVARNVGPDGPAGFDVWTKDGRLRRYGFTGDSVDGGPQRRWRLSQESDRSGNTIDTVYRTECQDGRGCTEPALSEIRYGGQADQASERLVRFVYDVTPSDRVVYSRGDKRVEWRRLARVETVAAGTVVRSYRLDYRTKDDTSILSTVRECVSDPGGEVCKPPTTLDHIDATGYPGTVVADESETLVSAAFGNAPLSSRFGPTLVLDANGDGREDLIFPGANGNYLLSLATGNRATPWTAVDTGLSVKDICLSQEYVADLDGDGLDDLVTCGRHMYGATAYFSSGRSFRADKNVLKDATDYDAIFWLADLDGDGRTDVMKCSGSIWSLSGGTFFTMTNYPRLPNGSSPGEGGTPGDFFDCGTPLFIDVDGDGVVNAVKSEWAHLGYVTTGSTVTGNRWRRTLKALVQGANGLVWVDAGLSMEVYYDGSERSVEEEPNYPPGWGPRDDAPPAEPPYRQLRSVDNNGDGLTDLLVIQPDSIVLYTNTGRGFVAGPNLRRRLGTWDWTRLKTPAQFAAARFYDVDGDGRTDALLPVGNQNGWVLRRAGAEAEQAGTWPADPLPPVLADVDGDGSRDVILAEPTTTKDAAGNLRYRMIVRYGDQARSGLLQQVQDGAGRRVTFSYGTGASVYSRSDGCPDKWSRCLPGVGPLVRQMRVEAAQRPARGSGVDWAPAGTYRYTYQDARLARYGRGYLGVGRRTETTGDPDGRTLSTNTRDFGNGRFVQSPGGNVLFWYSGAGRLVAERTVSAPIQSGRHRNQLLVTRTAITAVRQVSTDGRPFMDDQVTEVVREATDTAGQDVTRLGSSTVRSSVNADGNVETTSTTWLNRNRKQVAQRVETTSYDTSPARREQRLLGLATRKVVTETRGGRSVARGVTFTNTADRGLLESTTTDPDDARNSLLTTTTYDRFGNPTKVTRSAPGRPELGTRTTATQWDGRGLLPVSTTDALGHVSTVVQDATFGTPLVQVDPNGVVVRTAYDGFGRPVRRRTAVGDTVTNYARVDDDPTAERAARVRTTTTVAGGRISLTEVDALGRTVRTGISGYQSAMIVTDTAYDPQGRPVGITRPHRTTLPEARSEYQHDPLGRLTQEIQPDEQGLNNEKVTTRFAYSSLGGDDMVDGGDPAVQDVAATQIDVSTAGSGVATTSVEVRDYAGDVVSRRDDNSTITQFVRGPFGIIDRIIDADGKVTTFESDAQGRTTAVDSPDGGRHVYAWTPFGDLEVEGDAENHAIRYEYDPLGRMISRQDADGVASWQYDGAGPNTIGKLTGTRSPGHTVTYGYEPVPADGPNRGLLTSSTETIDGNTLVTRFGYDAYGQLNRTEYPPSGGQPFAVDQRYDEVGNLIDLRQSGQATPYWEFTRSYDGIHISDEKLGGSIAVHSTYGQLSGRRSRTAARVGDTVMHDLAVDYDEFGKVDGVYDHVDEERNDTMSYDSERGSQRLSAWALAPEQEKGPEALTYRPAGQIDNKEGIGDYRYDSRPRAVVTAGKNSYVYDADGRQTGRTGPDVPGGRQMITYTASGLTSSVETGPATAPEHQQITRFGYDAQGQRILRTSPDSVTAYASDLYERYQDRRTGAVEHRYNVKVNGRVIARVVRSQPAGSDTTGPDTVSYLLADNVGSPRTVLNEDGSKRQAQQWTAYGRPVEPTQQAAGEIGFAGLREDPGLGLVDAGGRMYDPVLGRFLTPDPVLFDVTGGKSPADTLVGRIAVGKRPGGGPPMLAADLLDPYAYAGNNPAAYVDPTGRAPEPPGLPRRTPLDEWSSAARGYATGLVYGFMPFGWAMNPGVRALGFDQTYERNRALGGLAASTIKTVYGLLGMTASLGLGEAGLAAAPVGGGVLVAAAVVPFAVSSYTFWDGYQGMQAALSVLADMDPNGNHLAGQAWKYYGMLSNGFKAFTGKGLPSPFDIGKPDTAQDAQSRAEQFTGDLTGIDQNPVGIPNVGNLSLADGPLFGSYDQQGLASFDNVSMGVQFLAPILETWSLFDYAYYGDPADEERL